jgi:hypothetical protein
MLVDIRVVIAVTSVILVSLVIALMNVIGVFNPSYS